MMMTEFFFQMEIVDTENLEKAELVKKEVRVWKLINFII